MTEVKMKWIYTTEICTESFLMELLSECGEKGWEAFQIIKEYRPVDGDCYRIFLKKQVSER